ncbi:Hypothetical protein, conserved [Brucella suis ATCC 23445]|uniref:Uncharacterized protein n=1 Tax=Brucella suis (strain ATCC 23445 / NCTC 10510) TaxID=470137 RepID=B0CL61_BRUSI|nr:Hypothetical protein, conserved [Brucella suis ATCC 23445]
MVPRSTTVMTVGTADTGIATGIGGVQAGGGIARIGAADTEAMARAPISDRTAAMVRTADKTAKALQQPLAKSVE